MELIEVLTGMDAGAAAAALDGAFDKFVLYEETGVMVDDLVDGFPALAVVVARLDERVGEEPLPAALAEHLVIGCAIGLLSVVQYAHAEQLRRHLGPAPGVERRPPD